MVTQTVLDNSDDIENRDNKQRIGQQQTMGIDGHGMAINHHKLDDQKTEQESQGKAAAIAHEYLAVFLGLAKQVEVQIGNEYSSHSGYDDAVGVEPLLVIAIQES